MEPLTEIQSHPPPPRPGADNFPRGGGESRAPLRRDSAGGRRGIEVVPYAVSSPEVASSPPAVVLNGQLSHGYPEHTTSLALRHLHLSKLPAAREPPPLPDCYALASKRPVASKIPSEHDRPSQHVRAYSALRTLRAPDGEGMVDPDVESVYRPHVYPRCSTTCVCGPLRPCCPHREVPPACNFPACAAVPSVLQQQQAAEAAGAG